MDDRQSLVECVAALVAEMSEAVRVDAPIGALTTYRVGGRADALVTLQNVAEFEQFAKIVALNPAPVLIIGRGSNMLVSDEGFRGVAVQLAGEFTSIESDGDTLIAGAAVSLPILARRSVTAGLTGLEWAVGVPGSVGGAVCMNAGGHGSQTSDSLTSAYVASWNQGRRGWFSPTDLEMSYRSSNLTAAEVVLTARFSLAQGDTQKGEARIDEIVNWRRAHQPGGQNAGSVFRNPEGHFAGEFIDNAGLKGLRIGTAFVHEKHANFIQADESGKANDVMAVINAVREKIYEDCGVWLEPEVRLIGFGGNS